MLDEQFLSWIPKLVSEDTSLFLRKHVQIECTSFHLSSSKTPPLHPKQELCHNKAPRKLNPARRKPA